MGFPLLVASHFLFVHDMLDMATHYASHYDVTTELRIDATGNATLHVAGSLTREGIELLPGTGARTVMPSHTVHIDDTWTGRATLVAGAVIVRFDHHRVFGAIDVTWRCDASTTTVASYTSGGAPITTAVWKCATSQSMTQPSGPGMALEPYMQVPTYFAAPSVALRVDETARGGADHRSSPTVLSLRH